MALFGVSLGRRDFPIRGDTVYLRPAEMRDFTQWAALREQSRAFLTPWEPSWPDDELMRSAFRRRLRLYARAIRAAEAYPFFVIRKADNRLLGGLTLSNIRRGVTQAATLGTDVPRSGPLIYAVQATRSLSVFRP